MMFLFVFFGGGAYMRWGTREMGEKKEMVREKGGGCIYRIFVFEVGTLGGLVER